MLALISPNENNRICQVQDTDFPIAEPLFWETCPEDCTTEWTYVDGVFEPPAPPAVPTADENKATASGLLQATDWTQIPSVSDPSLSNPYLSNKLAFDQYRNEVRQYAVYPVEGDITWPTIPEENWVKV
jgi:hypothetical protein